MIGYKGKLVREDGTLQNLTFVDSGNQQKVEFHSNDYAGPSLYIISSEGKQERVNLNKSQQENTYSGFINGLDCKIEYVENEENLCIKIEAQNNINDVLEFKKFFLRLGVDCFMTNYPDWRDQYFPTLLRCEKTHFWGYAMSPNGDILGIASPDPVNSWTIDYEMLKVDNPDCDGIVGTTRLMSFCLDLMHTGPLPKRNPEPVTTLEPGQSKKWDIYLYSVEKLEDVKVVSSLLCNAPMIHAPRYSVGKGEKFNLTVYSKGRVTASLIPESGDKILLDCQQMFNSKSITEYEYEFNMEESGQYRFIAETPKGKVSECVLAVLEPFSWCLKQARSAADKHKQYASSHLEQWLGLHSAFLARRYFPDEKLDSSLQKRFIEIIHSMWDVEKGKPLDEKFGRNVFRIFSNTAQMISVLTDAYEATGEIKWLELAANFADYISTWQSEEGCYEVPDCIDHSKKINYTSVFYPAKSLMELCLVEKVLGKDDPKWQFRYQKHFADAKKAIDYLENANDNITTEGFQTFEDGMISCSATQLSMFALMQEDAGMRDRYCRAAEFMFLSHRIEEQLLIPDARMTCGTIRFWEAQYDVLARGGQSSMLCSPHGWSAWSLYGIYYMYLLSGEEKWLQQLFNGIGACMLLIDNKKAELNWAFICDPYREVRLLEEDKENPGKSNYYDKVINEEPLPMIPSFHYPDKEPVLGNSPRNGWSCCNDVHEVFKCMAETVLVNAFVVERNNGEIIGYNCQVAQTGNDLEVTPNESVIERVSFNLKQEFDIKVKYAGNIKKKVSKKGFFWI